MNWWEENLDNWRWFDKPNHPRHRQLAFIKFQKSLAEFADKMLNTIYGIKEIIESTSLTFGNIIEAWNKVKH